MIQIYWIVWLREKHKKRKFSKNKVQNLNELENCINENENRKKPNKKLKVEKILNQVGENKKKMDSKKIKLKNIYHLKNEFSGIRFNINNR